MTDGWLAASYCSMIYNDDDVHPDEEDNEEGGNNRDRGKTEDKISTRHRIRPPLRLGLVQPVETISSLSLPVNIPPSESGSSHVVSLSVRSTELLKHHRRPRTAHAPLTAQEPGPFTALRRHRPPWSRHLLRTRVFDSFMRAPCRTAPPPGQSYHVDPTRLHCPSW